VDLYATIQDVRDRGVDEDAADDLTVTRALSRARMMIDAYCGRDFLRRRETYYVDGSGTGALFLEDRPVVKVTKLAVDGMKVEPESYCLYEDAGYIRMTGDRTIFMGYPGTFPAGVQNVEVTGIFGFDVVPDEVVEASVILALMFLRMMRAEANVTESQANSTDKAIGIKRVKVDDLSVDFEYPRETVVDASRKRTTGLAEADRLLWRHRRDLEAVVI
jgi:hypothetical protein